MRTMGETRLWYSFFLALSGIIVYARTRYRWMVGLSTIMSTVFVVINLLKPEIHTKAMMPALQSAWFAPHVIVYMFAYALFGAATLMAIVLLWRGHRAKKQGWAGRINCTEALPICSICTIVSFPIIAVACPFASSSSLFVCCKCAGGASIICLLRRAQASIHIIANDLFPCWMCDVTF